MLLGAWLAVAMAGPVHPAWSELAAWRTWLVLEDVQPARHWFALEDTPMLGKRCEVGLVAEGKRGPPVVWCGPARVSDTTAREAPEALKKAEEQARAALAPFVGDKASLLDDLRMRYLGTLRDVTFRQIVVVRQDPDPTRARAVSLTATWQVDAETERVDRGPLAPGTRLAPICAPGIHVGCEAPPRLMDWAPEPGWEGMLYDARWMRGDAPLDERLAAVVRGAARAGAAFQPAPPRKVSGGALADDMDAAAALTILTAVDGQERRHLVDLPLNDLVSGPVIVRFPVEGTPARVEVIVRLGEGQLEVSLQAPDLESAGIRLPLSCEVLVDGANGVLLAPCVSDSVGQWAMLTDAAGAEVARVRVEGTIEPLLVPSVGPGLR